MEKLLCPECLKVVAPSVIEREETLPVRGADVTVLARVAVCPACGEDIGTDTLDDATLIAAYDVYRSRHGLLQPEHIRAIRSKYGLGQKAFARLLGWGDVTLARYETGSLQSKSHDTALRLAEDPEHVRELLRLHGDRLSDEQRRTLEARLGELSSAHEGLLVREEASTYSADAGPRKLAEMAVLFAELPAMWRTKLNKMLFYADFLHAKRHGRSISGARYVHMQYGPVPADFYALQARLVDGGDIDEVPAQEGDCSGTVFVASRPADREAFSAEELQTLKDVAAHFEGWTASRLVEFSHREPAWAETHDRETIPLAYAERLQIG